MSEKDNQTQKDGPAEKKAPCQVTFYLDEQGFKGTSLHFSERGLLVNCQTPAPLNRKVKLVLMFPGLKNAMEVQGEVVWTNVHGQADSFSPRGMGVKFLGVDRDAERLLAELAEQYDCLGSTYSCYYT